jgi:uncharacterized paraquat-inducible protein A
MCGNKDGRPSSLIQSERSVNKLVSKDDLKKPTKPTNTTEYINTFTCNECGISFSLPFSRKRYLSRHNYNAECPNCGVIQTVHLHLRNDQPAAMLLSTYMAAKTGAANHG